MKIINSFFFALLFSTSLCAQIPAPKAPTTVDGILAKYYEASGGRSRWDSLQNVRMRGKVTVQGMEIPITILQTAEGMKKSSIKFQGQETVQTAYDGTVAWNSNFMTQRPEKMSPEATAIAKQQAAEFVDALLKYKERGLTATLGENENIEGREAFKIKLIKKPVTLDGEEVENIDYYFFDTETFLPVASRYFSLTGQTQGAAVENLLSDYRPVGGLLFPFSVDTSYNGQLGEALRLETIEANVVLNPTLFAFPD